MNRFIRAFIVSIALASAVGCSVTSGQKTAGELVDDAAITSRVKTRFANDPTVSAMRIHVNTDKGVVNLSGTAKSQAEREQAERMAAGVPDVKSVQNNITVDSTSSDTTNR
jgi:osmotically-inducible protein OsmY